MCPGLFFFGDDFFLGVGSTFFLSLAPGFSDRTVPGRGVPVRDFLTPDPRFLAVQTPDSRIQTPGIWSISAEKPGFPDSWPWDPKKSVRTPGNPGNGRFRGFLRRFLL